jgi:hypothetical protein
MISYLIYYIGDYIGDHPRLYNHLASVFTPADLQNPLPEMKILEDLLNVHYFDNPVTEVISPDRIRPLESLKLWARLTLEVLKFDNRFTRLHTKELEDEAVAKVFCHWEAMFHYSSTVPLRDDFDAHQRIKHILDACEILSHEDFCKKIEDPYNILGKKAKHAVPSLFHSNIN